MLKPKRKITKKEIKRDPLLETLFSAQRFYASYRKRILSLVMGLGVVLGIILITITARNTSRREARNMLATSLTRYQAEDYTSSIGGLSNLIAEFPNTNAAKEALYYLGLSQLEQGNHEEARNSLEKYLEEGTNSFLTVGALETMAGLAESEKDYAQAAIYYERASAITVIPFIKNQNLINAVSNWIKAGNYINANNLLENLETEEEADFLLKSQFEELRSKLDLVASNIN